ncbi:sigma-70 family RNA polymerase sigma factor [Pseudoflavonifractor phocaeensis]|uniref:sigma-70 family RNA polymerase sigma factor n=1 Tax=Pseudoflavonifractor phocaeensis TaxID=1870988 RepID=UPI001956C76A|nr:sigma-70 family RNA polymerase sigma factor [Pseudoflavonifractor phocaeensis]MBM6926613.1 sigma-70 family RNA polymerase sigma factor [Pseudoflavonifractor phocaeensis]
MDKYNLSSLIQWCREGNPYAQEELVRITQNRIYFHCRKMLKQEQDALDATQDILIITLTSLDKLRDPNAFWGWVSGITANQCRRLLSKRGQVWQIPEDEEGNSMLDQVEDLDQQRVPDQALDNQETRRMILELVDGLPPEQRMCVLFYYYDQMSVKDIAQAMEVSEGTVKSRLNYARKAIKAGVERYEKQGVKLYGLSPIPFLLYFLRVEAQHGMGNAAAQAMAHQVVSASLAAAGGGAGASAAGAAASSQTAAAGTAAGQSAAAGAAGAAAGTAGMAAAASGISAKVIAGVLAGVITLGGGGLVLSNVLNNSAVHAVPTPTPVVQPQAPVSAQATAVPTPSVQPTQQAFSAQQPEVVRTDLTPPIDNAEVYFEIPVFADATGGYAVINEFFQRKQEEFFSPDNQLLAELPEIAAQMRETLPGDTCSYVVSAAVHDSTEQIFSVRLKNSMYFGGVVSGENECYIFDPQTGEQLSLSDLVSVDSVEELKEFIVQALVEQYPWLDSRSDILENVYDLDYTMNDFNFYVQDGLVHIIFDKYEIAEGAAGIFSVSLPLTLDLLS